jgi:hypothetical protein
MVLEDLLSFVSISHLVSFFLVFLVEYVHACINGNVVLPLVEEFHPFTFGYVVDDQWNCIQKKKFALLSDQILEEAAISRDEKNDIRTVSSMLILHLRSSSDRNSRVCRD